jgi:hypothetical protein
MSRLNQDGLGDEEEEERFGGGAEPAGADLYAGAVGSVLVEGRSVGLPGRHVTSPAFHHSPVKPHLLVNFPDESVVTSLFSLPGATQPETT